ncbi:E3 ubiquitin-protein ligase [Platanthera zijinensis]|uniref:RING-type E3 ubiquitin transferase n=1 Tax=Platanthera zijinensis TaxID=2320716 RepID=A0AAP0C234_9ASPA
MGGCCCCSARRTASNGLSVYYYCPEDLEENGTLSSARGPPPVVPALLVNPDLVTCQEPTIQPPREDLSYTQSNTESTENYANKNEHNQPTDTVPEGNADMVGFTGSDSYDVLKGLEYKSLSDFVTGSPNVKEKLSKLDNSVVLVPDEEDVCPTCLEEYDAENPRIITKCQHHFHLSCILEWFERSNTCAICDRIMEIDNMAVFDQSS